MMNKKNELSYKDLKAFCNTDSFNFETTAELDSNDKGIGQDSAIRSLELVLIFRLLQNLIVMIKV